MNRQSNIQIEPNMFNASALQNERAPANRMSYGLLANAAKNAGPVDIKDFELTVQDSKNSNERQKRK